jgi:hypothetical protein
MQVLSPHFPSLFFWQAISFVQKATTIKKILKKRKKLGGKKKRKKKCPS